MEKGRTCAHSHISVIKNDSSSRSAKLLACFYTFAGKAQGVVLLYMSKGLMRMHVHLVYSVTCICVWLIQ